MNTERLIIRHFKDSDAKFILKLLNDESFIKNIGDKKVRSVEDAIQYLNDGPFASYKLYGFGLNMIQLKASGEPIGMCGLLKRERFEYPDLGYALLPEFCGRGYAKEASSAVMKNGHEHHNLHTILAFTSPENKSSNILLKRLGFAFKDVITVDGADDNLYEFKFID